VIDKTVWTRFAIILLGLWMIAQPITFDTKNVAMTISDMISGTLLLFLGSYAVFCSNRWILWAICLVGVWLQFAPLLFWAPESGSYINDVLVGALVIAASVLFPANPEEEKLSGSPVPSGWSYNPSAWFQRLPIVFFGFFAWMFARYMAAFQLGYLDHVVDPVFGDGTDKVITSWISKAFPVPDAGLGAMAYTLEVLMACHGGSSRWHKIPWFVLLFAILVIPLGLVSIILIIMQPILVHAWCFWCLLTAACMLVMIAFAIDEAAAVLQFLAQAKREGKSVWDTLWKGGNTAGSGGDERSLMANRQLSTLFPAMAWGVSVPWNLLITSLLGLWLMFSPHILDIFGPASDSDHIVGALVVALSVISMAEVVRAGRYLVLLLGLWILISSWVLPDRTLAGTVDHTIVGLLLILFSIPKGQIKEKYGAWEKFIF
jgi:uncharacterized membrane protein